MTAISVAVCLAAMLFMLYLGPGFQAEAGRRCVMCGARRGERHHRDCQWRDSD